LYESTAKTTICVTKGAASSAMLPVVTPQIVGFQFADLELTGDAAPGAIVEAHAYEDAQGRNRLSLANMLIYTAILEWL